MKVTLPGGGRWRASARAGRQRLAVSAFLGVQDLAKAAICVPTPFISSANRKSGCPINLIDDRTRYRGSHFGNDLFPERNGEEAFAVALRRWETAYTNSGGTQLVVADEHNQEAFVFFATELINTGSFGNASATGRHSQVLGMYRVHLDPAGHAEEVWMYRSGTEEEHQHLLRQGILSAGRASTALPSVVLEPCTWATDQFYAAAILSNAGTWTQDVMSQGCMSSLMRVAAPDMTLTDGTGLLHAPLKGSVAVGCSLVEQMSQCELHPRVVAAQVMEQGGNKVCQHWSQTRICRSSGQQTTRTGTSLLVFDSKARIQQVYEFVGLDQPHTGFVDSEAVAQILACYPDSGTDGGPAAVAARAAQEQAEAEALRLAEEAECLARQEREWSSW